LHRPKSNVFATEFLRGQLGSLLIHGDGPDLLIRTYRDTPLLSKISLLATSNYDYITEKVVIGNAEEFSLDVFRQEIEDDIERHTKDEDVSTELVSSLKKLRLKTECEMSFRNAVWDYYPDPSDCPNYGTVPSNNLIMAKMAAKRVLELYIALLGSPKLWSGECSDPRQLGAYRDSE
jgi:hypothetical protein